MVKEFAIYSRKLTGYYTMPKYDFHDYFEIYYLVSGHRYYYIENKRYSLQRGSILFIDRNEIHKSVDSGAPNHERFVIYFTNQFLSRFRDEQLQLLLSLFKSENKKVQFSLREQSYIERLLFQMQQEFKKEDGLGRELFFESLLVQLLLFAARKREVEQPDNQKDPMNSRMRDIIDFCNRNFREDLHLDELAERFHLSPFYLSRLFKRTTGFTFKEYINTLRIREAERLLRETELKVIDISAHVGFANVSHFNRKFKQVTRMSPKEFKQYAEMKKH